MSRCHIIAVLVLCLALENAAKDYNIFEDETNTIPYGSLLNRLAGMSLQQMKKLTKYTDFKDNTIFSDFLRTKKEAPIAIIIVKNILGLADSIRRTPNISENTAINRYNKVLNSIADLNSQRLTALQKYTDLEATGAVKGILRVDNTNNQVMKIIEPKEYNVAEINQKYKSGPKTIPKKTPIKSIIAYLKNSNNDNINNLIGIDITDKHESKGMSIETNAGDDQMSDENVTLGKKDILRFWRSCSKKAAKACGKACFSAYKKVCSDYSCSKSMKRKFKKQCKSSCKKQFDRD